MLPKVVAPVLVNASRSWSAAKLLVMAIFALANVVSSMSVRVMTLSMARPAAFSV